MSRIGNRILQIPSGVTVNIDNDNIVVKGPKGELTTKIPSALKVEQKENTLVITRENDLIPTKAVHGTLNANINNMIKGVSEGFEKGLEIIGVGYRFNLKGNTLVINAGYSDAKEVQIPAGIKVEVKSNTEITISGIDKVLVGEFAAKVRKVRKPEPYKGKGIRYAGEHIRRKEGKKAK